VFRIGQISIRPVALPINLPLIYLSLLPSLVIVYVNGKWTMCLLDRQLWKLQRMMDLLSEDFPTEHPLPVLMEMGTRAKKWFSTLRLSIL
jgi:hypothetical protein